MLLPLSGEHAALGRSMARAAALAQGPAAKGLVILDSGDTPEGAATAAREALKRGAGLILGPLFSAQVRPVLAAAGGRVPVLSFSNDAGLIESGAFLLGITAEQSVSAVLHYARGRGVRRLALGESGAGWRGQVAAAALRAAPREGLEIVASGGDALLLADAAVPARAGDVQLLCAFAGLDPDVARLAALEGAWIAAPDPAPFADFAAAFEARNGSAPGEIAGLAFDAGAIALALGRSGGSDRSALLAPAGFKGVCGDIRFREDGSATRAMAILAVERGRYRLVDRSGAA